MNEFKSQVDPTNSHYKRNHSVIDVEAKVASDTDQNEDKYNANLHGINGADDKTNVKGDSSLAVNGTKKHTHGPSEKPLSTNPIIAFFQSRSRMAKAFYAKHKKPINIGLGIIGIGGVIIATVVGFWLINIWNNESSLAGLGQQPSESSIVYAADGTTELYRYYEEENRDVVPLDQISENMQVAIVALEDENFYYNESGVPWRNLFGAVFKCAISIGDECRGASGLSQQLIKNVKKDNESSLDRKVRELFTAVKLNQEATKEDILGQYLNWVPFGRNAYGIEQAANGYFGKKASQLDVVESCYLASMVQRPSYFDSGIGKPESQAFSDLEGRKNACLDKIYSKDLKPGSERLIKTQEELEQLKKRPAEFKARGSNYKYPHFKDFVSSEITKFVNEQDLLTGGYKIITTLDPGTQDAVQASVNNRAAEDIIPAGANNAAVVVLDGPTSEIRAMVGSLDYNNAEIDGQVNVATAPRQPGSSIKPYVYASSFKQGLYPGSVLLDVPTEFESGYQPKNFSGTFNGVISVRDSLANSLNIPAVKAAYLSSPSTTPNGYEGINAVFDTATDMGVQFPCIPASDGAVCNTDQASDAYRSRCGVSAALGGCEVSLLSHVNGFNTFAQDGKFQQATPFKSIVNIQGEDVYAKRQNSTNPVYKKNDRAVDPLIAREISSILSDYSARYRAFGNTARRLELEGWTGENAVAAKTGTTNDVKDTWTVGYSPYYSVAVWVGNTDSTPLSQRSTSVGTTSGIWNDTMVYLHQNKEKRGFSKEGLKSIRIDPTTGLPDEGGSKSEYITDAQLQKLNKAKENLKNVPEYNPLQNYYVSNGTVNYRGTVKINKLDGKLAVPGKTLDTNTEDKSFNMLVAEYPGWQRFATDWMSRTPDLYPPLPTEKSDQDQVSQQQLAPTITSNLDSGTSNISKIQVTVTPQGLESKKITKIELLIDGSVKATVTDTETLSFTDISSYTSGNHTVLIRVEDSFGAKKEQTYSGVTFKEAKDSSPTPIDSSELSSLNITCTQKSAGATSTDCSFELSGRRSLPSDFSVRIDNSGNGTCTASISGGSSSSSSSKTTVTCPSVLLPVNPIPGKKYPIKAKVETSYVETANTYEVKSTI